MKKILFGILSNQQMQYQQGDIILIPFPYSDLTSQKRRPAIVISGKLVNTQSQDIVLAQITSQLKNDGFSFHLNNSDLTNNLIKQSEVRCNKIFTADQKLVIKKVSHLKKYKLKSLLAKISQTVLEL